jgi:hypothetical protein
MLTQIGFIHPDALVLDVSLKENHHAIVGTTAQYLRGGLHEPSLPLV